MTQIPQSRLTRTGIRHHYWPYRGGLATRGIPSPDGLHLAIEGWSLGSNVWMMENF